MGVRVTSRVLMVFLIAQVTICQTVPSTTHEDCPRCENGGNCTGPDYECSCPPGFYGMRCEMCENRTCSPGICTEYMNMTKCLCPGAYLMPYCPMECNNRTCQNGGACMISKDGSPRCKNCPPYLSGRYCEVNETRRVDCKDTMCHQNNTRICTNTSQEVMSEEVMCHCKKYFTGKYCEVKLCKVQTCDDMGYSCNMTLSPSQGDCECMKGWTGRHCEIMMDPCESMPCMNNGTCHNESGLYRCSCKPPWQGEECNEMETTPTPPTTPTTEPLPQTCLDNNCTEKNDNGICDLECFTKECRHDGRECTADRYPWMNCDKFCGAGFEVFNSVCSDECNSENCLFDGFDCVLQGFGKSTCDDDEYCSMNFDDGTCDEKCNVSACGYDGLDCESMHKYEWHPVYRLGSLRIRHGSTNLTVNQIGYHLSRLLRVILYQRKTSNSDMMSNFMMPNEIIYEVDNRFGCDLSSAQSCWTNIDSIADFLGAYVLAEKINRRFDPIMIQQISGSKECPPTLFGPNCTRTCSKNCKDDRCDKITGECLMDCNAGFTGYNCTTECMDGYYGENCKYDCPNCKNRNCNKAVGTCLEGCEPGYMNSLCKSECAAGTYGEDCAMLCSGTCATVCDHVTGRCTSCRPGYRGATCTEKCEEGKYGQDCASICSRNCEDMDCDAVTGHCSDDGCKPGYIGDKCSMKCPSGKYGKDCMYNCSVHCFNMDECNIMNGKCPRCKDGYKGEMCNENPAKATTTSPPSRRSGGGSSGGIIAGIIILILAIIIAICVAVWFWRRSQGGDYDLDKKATTERPIAMDEVEIENELVTGNHLSTAALVPLDSTPENETLNKSEQETMVEKAEQNAIGNDETKPLIEEKEGKEPDGKESGGRESIRDSVYKPEVEGGPGGVYVGPGKPASETIPEKVQGDEQTPGDQDAKNEETQEPASNDVEDVAKTPEEAPSEDKNPSEDAKENPEEKDDKEKDEKPTQQSEENSEQTDKQSEENKDSSSSDESSVNDE